MIITIQKCVVENVSTYTSQKSGFGANVTLSQIIDKKRDFLTINTNDAKMINLLESCLQETVDIDLEFTDSKFGMRLGAIKDLRQ